MVVFFIVGALCMIALCVLAFVDIFKSWKMRKRDELRRQSFIDSVQHIALYYRYKGISDGFDMEL